MRKRLSTTVVCLMFILPAAAQAPANRIPRLNGKPNLNGIWQTVNTANWNLEAHAAQMGAVWQVGALGAVPAGPSFVEGGEIPYQPAARAKRDENFVKRASEDPEVRCYLPGVPRATYMPYPFQIAQSNSDILMMYEYASANRLVNMGKPRKAGSDTWMGTSNGRWEGDTLVIDVTGLNGLAWFDRSGNYASDRLHVVERFTMIDADHLNYEATMEDASVFTRPWKISVPLYRRIEKNAQLYDFKCVEFAEDLIYNQYVKNPKK